MKNLDIVRTFVERGNKARFAETREFTVDNGSDRVAMLGTFSPRHVAELGSRRAKAAQ